MLKKKKSYLVPFIGFTLMIIVGAILLVLPISNNEPIEFKDALFVSISAISCTGLSTVVPVEQFSFIGQLVIAILMEIGALGFIVFISYIWAKINKKMKMSDIIMVNDNISGDKYAYTRYMEDTRSLKGTGSVVVAKDDEAQIIAACQLIDYFYSEEGAILQNYGPKEYREGIVKIQGVSYPKINSYIF